MSGKRRHVKITPASQIRTRRADWHWDGETVTGMDRRAIEHAADRALMTGRPARVPGYDAVVVPDVVIAELVANGHDEPPTTWTLVRDDGRVGHLYRWPGAS
jgi:hypothetical protein